MNNEVYQQTLLDFPILKDIEREVLALRRWAGGKTYNDAILQIANLQFSIDKAIDSINMSEELKKQFADIYSSYIARQSAIDWTLPITSARFQDDASLIFVPSTATLSSNMRSAFDGCGHLLYLSPFLDWSGVTDITYLTRGALGLMAQKEYEFDCTNISNIGMYCVFPKITFKNMNAGAKRIINAQFIYSGQRSITKEIHGLDLSYITQDNPHSGNKYNWQAEKIRFADGSKIPFASWSIFANEYMDAETLWLMCKHAYDYNHPDTQTDAQGRSLVRTKAQIPTYDVSSGECDFHFGSAHKTMIESYVNSNPKIKSELLSRFPSATTISSLLTKYMEDKGWSY